MDMLFEEINHERKIRLHFHRFMQNLHENLKNYEGATDPLKKIVKDSHEMIYFISMLSTTGGKLKVSSKEILSNYDKIKKINSKKNVVIGFGITEKTIKSLKKADGLVVGSAICREITNSIKKRQNPVTNVYNVVKRLKKKIR